MNHSMFPHLQFDSCGKVFRAPLGVYLCLLSAGLLIVTVALERVYVVKKTSKSGNILFFMIVRQTVSIYSEYYRFDLTVIIFISYLYSVFAGCSMCGNLKTQMLSFW